MSEQNVSRAPSALAGKKVLVMGLGLHGGGLETVRYLLKKGARVSCTDLRTASDLAPTLTALKGLPVRFVLGEHRREDFDAADIIVKNPAVPSDSSWLKGRTNIETDLSLFLKNAPGLVLAVTGSKGKSTVVSALHYILKKTCPGARLGGNITVSPLSFADELTPGDPVVLELSSWQLADLRGRGLLKPRIACITNLMHDHQNRYASFADYESDKKVILENLSSGDFAVFPHNHFGRQWAEETAAQCFLIGENGNVEARRSSVSQDELRAENLVPRNLKVPGEPFRLNMLFAGVMARLWGIPAREIRAALESFPGVPYRMELFLETGGIRFYDDTTATIPDAAAAAVQAMDGPFVLIAGGNDKNLDFSPLDDVLSIPRRVVLLEGTATPAIAERLRKAGKDFDGPFGSMEEAVRAAVKAAIPAAGKKAAPASAVLLSPGATSFGIFHHEFERGDAFKAACRKIMETG